MYGTAPEVSIAAGLDIGHQETAFKDHEIHDSDPFIYCYSLHETIIQRTYKKENQAGSFQGWTRP